jgi:hypothetical protein
LVGDAPEDAAQLFVVLFIHGDWFPYSPGLGIRRSRRVFACTTSG